jgi:hypothetical protein
MNSKQKKTEKAVKKNSENFNHPQKDKMAKNQIKEEHGPLVEAAENIEEGAKIVREKVSEVASSITEKTSEVTGPLIDKVKDSVSDIAELSKKVLDEISQTAQEYVEKYRHKAEMKKIGEERKELTIKLGTLIYIRYKVRNIGPENLFQDQEILRLMKDIEEKDKEIIKKGKELDDHEG